MLVLNTVVESRNQQKFHSFGAEIIVLRFLLVNITQGENGVRTLLQMLKDEFSSTMALAGLSFAVVEL
jgi:isopentenyl diphosphate isomerase/L-lactate dehydrogenase-like FMN-dependent dehydrogenase